MKAFVAVFRRELLDHRQLFLAALGLGVLLPIALTVVPVARAGSAADLRIAAALVTSVVMTVGMILLLGIGTFARPLAEGRLAFFFSRPLPTGAILGGKLAAALTALFGTLGLLWLPTALLSARQVFAEVDALPVWLAAVGIVAGLAFAVVAVHLATVALLGRGVWLAVELAALAFGSLAVLYALRLLFAAWADDAITRLGLGLGFGGGALVTAAALAALAAGRTDLALVHRRQSLGVAAVVALLSLGSVGYARWYVDVEVADLTAVRWATSAPTGGWAAVAGVAAGREAMAHYLLGPAGEEVFVGWGDRFFPAPRFSPDGRLVAWHRVIQESPRHFTSELVIADLTRGATEILAVPVHGYSPLFVWTKPGTEPPAADPADDSADGSAAPQPTGSSRSPQVILVSGRELLRVRPEATATPTRLLELPRDHDPNLLELTPDGLIELVSRAPREPGAAQFGDAAWLIDPGNGEVLRRGVAPADLGTTFDRSHRRVLVSRPPRPTEGGPTGPWATLVVDVASGTTVFELPWQTRFRDAWFLTDHSLVAIREQVGPQPGPGGAPPTAHEATGQRGAPGAPAPDTGAAPETQPSASGRATQTGGNFGAGDGTISGSASARAGSLPNARAGSTSGTTTALATLFWLSPDGTLRNSIPLGAPRARVIATAGPATVVLALTDQDPGDEPTRQARLVRVDLVTGALTPLLAKDEAVTSLYASFLATDPSIFLTSDGTLFAVDPASGAVTLLREGLPTGL